MEFEAVVGGEMDRRHLRLVSASGAVNPCKSDSFCFSLLRFSSAALFISSEDAGGRSYPRRVGSFGPTVETDTDLRFVIEFSGEIFLLINFGPFSKCVAN